MTKAPVSARVASGNVNSYAWLWVLPLPSGKFRVALVEIARDLVDEDACFGEESINTRYLKIVGDVGEVDAAALEAGVDPGELEAPWHNDFPL
ncbi:hypothetical protein OG311_05075 [Streptomyces sp. NBC_01343]|uniref:hypothetical protein n=1 Tax=Streptomyces sp. NBC_01343 TaxID=2903832 RepID=UPI002E142445|nr:hypothetical protein OG311_05075 [Streptomyces sp. NBC_01343]